VPPDRPIDPRPALLSLATGDCAWMLLTTAMPGSARDSRLWVNDHQNRRAGDERESNRGVQDELLHDDLLQQVHCPRRIPKHGIT
jgi:hypothetical protein